jgi:hypothetical protein
MRRSIRGALLLPILIHVLLCGIPLPFELPAATAYTIINLGTLGDFEPEPWGINSAGQVVGTLTVGKIWRSTKPGWNFPDRP